jgi:hypothetical protein
MGEQVELIHVHGDQDAGCFTFLVQLSQVMNFRKPFPLRNEQGFEIFLGALLGMKARAIRRYLPE